MTEVLDKQQQLLRTVDRALDNFKKIGKSNLTPAKMRNRIGALKEVWAQIQNGDFTLRNSISAANRQSLKYFKEDHYEVYEEIYLTTLNYMAECLEEVDPYVSPNQSYEQERQPTGTTSAFSLSHLPPIKLPPFNGKYEE